MFRVSFKVRGSGTLQHTHTRPHTHADDSNSGADRHERPAELEASAAAESPEKAVRTLLNITKPIAEREGERESEREGDICKQESRTDKGLLQMSRSACLCVTNGLFILSITR